MSSVSAGYLRDATERLSAARRPAILLGPEGAGAVPLILEIADMLGAPIATTPDALSLIDGHRSCGVFSFGASAHVRRTFQRADLVLAVSALGEFSCRLGEAFARHSLVQVAETATCVGRRREPDLALLGPVAVTLQQLRNLLARNAIGR
jgi:thiamine pyrophosphate-dependent acetolactate synthase large subunit-like protein